VNLFDRLILTLYSLALIVISLFVMATSLNLISSDYIANAIEEIYSSSQVGLTYFVAAAIFFLISLKFLFTSVRGRGERSHTGGSVHSPTEYGDVKITLETIESIAVSAARRIRGIRDLKARVRTGDNKTSIHVKVTVDGETSIPSLVEQVQQVIKERVETIAGLAISEVTVLVSEVAQPGTGARVRRVE
jgi:uncharacterized alkaline shock family protein YloU